MGSGRIFASHAQTFTPEQGGQPLSPAVKYKLPVKMAIMNDRRQQMVYVWQKLFFDKLPGPLGMV